MGQETQAELPPWSATQAELTVAVSPSMAQTLQPLAEQFNGQDQRTPDGEPMRVVLLTVNPDNMVDQALGQPPFQAVNPDSSLWLGQMDQRWADLQTELTGETESSMAIGVRRVSDPVRYATSPIVIAAWESVAAELGWPDSPWAGSRSRPRPRRTPPSSGTIPQPPTPQACWPPWPSSTPGPA